MGESVSARVGMLNNTPPTSPIVHKPIISSKSSFGPLSPGRNPSISSNFEDGVASRLDPG